MENMLQELLNEVVVTPYDAQIIERLTEICNETAENTTVDDIDGYIEAFVHNKPDMELKKTVEDSYAEKYPDEEAIDLPPIFAIVLAQYIAIASITQYLDERDQATASLILMNHLLFRKGSLTRLILPNHIREMLLKIDVYIANQDKIVEGGEFRKMKELLSEPDYLDEHYQEVEVKAEVRKMAKTAYLYQQQIIIGKHKGVSEKKPYEKTYRFLLELLKNTPWKFTNNDVVTLLRLVLTVEGQKKTATIESIVKELVEAGVELPYDTLERSSLLLTYVQSGGKDVPQELKNRRLTVMEFGIYIYYELLLEYIIYEYYGSGVE